MTATALQTALESELEYIRQFVTLLEQEQASLIANTLMELDPLTKQKAALAQTLEALAKDRKRLFVANGVTLSDDPPHLMTAIRLLPPELLAPIASIWVNIIQAARQASALNNTNGQLIATRQQQNQQLMVLLQASQQANLSYDAYGQPRLSRPSGSLGKV
ncbi:flagella synthesis protein FlgN [Chitinimonas sp. BJYL2]|uniref:flagella synthesis protein FlgN n=1 Tax=Chitinimonas sp. BJYL2 TaxID=2976696 RepID=UPI0022B4E901|nr:flagellar protein FlgN [Chitinimonas sp. BJYL2]